MAIRSRSEICSKEEQPGRKFRTPLFFKKYKEFNMFKFMGQTAHDLLNTWSLDDNPLPISVLIHKRLAPKEVCCADSSKLGCHFLSWGISEFKSSESPSETRRHKREDNTRRNIGKLAYEIANLTQLAQEN
jgi:hypothetical protein